VPCYMLCIREARCTVAHPLRDAAIDMIGDVKF
jgi:hypothetical protein